MDIKSASGVGSISGPRPVAPESAQAERRETVKDNEAGEQVTLTRTAKSLADAARNSGGPAPVDRARVDRLRSAIGAGRYQVDSNRVAAKLLAADGELGGLPKA